ncbi:MAG: hypothetical protein RLZZ292_2615 [Bacteroidota bacterium]
MQRFILLLVQLLFAFHTAFAACDAPTKLTADAGANVAVLSWKAGSELLKFGLEYRVQSAATWTAAASVTASPFKLTGLESCTTYEFRVRGGCASGESAWSEIATFKTTGCGSTSACIAPKSLNASPSGTEAKLSWSSSATAFVLEYREVGTTTYKEITDITTTNYLLTGLVECKEYVFRVKAVCSPTVSSSFSELKTFKTSGCGTSSGECKTPKLSEVVASDSEAKVLWTSTATEFVVEFQEAGTGIWKVITGVTATNYVLTGLTPCKVYLVRVKAMCSATSMSGYSTKSFKTTGCNNPSGGECKKPKKLSIEVTKDGAIIKWDSVGTEYVIEYKEALTSVTTWKTASVNGLTYTITGLEPCKEYIVRIKNVCSATSMSGYISKTFKTLGCIEPCKVPKITKVSEQTINSIQVDWSKTSTIGYNLQYKEALAANATWTLINDLKTTSYVIKGLTACTNYLIQVQTICADGTFSNWSEPVLGKTKCVKGLNSDFVLFPNPSGNNPLSIHYTLEEASDVTIELVNAQGQLLSTILSGNFAAGNYDERIEASEQLPSGIYFVVFRSNENTQVQRWIKN